MLLRRNCSVALLALLLTLLACLPCQAYYDDTHYILNYYLARLCGYTPWQSFRMVSACRAIDYCPATEPCQYSDEAIGIVANNKKDVQTPRFRFHAFLNELEFPQAMSVAKSHDARKAESQLKVQREFLWDLAVNPEQTSDGNLGVFLHYFQDEYAHDGYGTANGHWFSPEAHKKGLPLGSYCDWLCSYDEAKHLDMMRKTVSYMQKFMQASCRGQSKGVRSNGPHEQDLKTVLAEMRQANVQAQPTDSSPNVKVRDPDYTKAYAIINRSLQEHGFKDKVPEQGIDYSFDSSGRIHLKDKDKWIMWGDINVTFSSPTAVSPITLVCESLQDGTRAPYEILRSEPIPLGQKQVSLSKVPVGTVSLKAMYAGKILASRRVSLHKAVQDEQMDLPELEIVSAEIKPSTITVGDKARLDIHYKMKNVPRESTITVQELIVMSTQSGSSNAYQMSCVFSFDKLDRKIAQECTPKVAGPMKFTWLLSTHGLFAPKSGELFLKVLDRPQQKLATNIEGLWDIGKWGMGGRVRFKRSGKGYIGVVISSMGIDGSSVNDVAYQLVPISANKLVGKYKNTSSTLNPSGPSKPVWEDWIFEITAPNTMLARRGRNDMLFTRVGD